VYFVTSEALSLLLGRPLSDEDVAEAANLCRAIEQEPLTDKARQALSASCGSGIRRVQGDETGCVVPALVISARHHGKIPVQSIAMLDWCTLPGRPNISSLRTR
jgi:hypothetical protein